jgi:hypothetical protein
MGAQYKSELYQLYKLTGRPMEKHFRDYTEAELTQLLIDANVDIGKSLKPEKATLAAEAADPVAIPQPTLPPTPPVAIPQPTLPPTPPVPVARAADPNEMPGQRLNTQAKDEVIRVDENGRQWLQEEVRKPAYPKPRGRRVLKYIDTGVEKQAAQNGEYVETFEVAGNRAGVPAEVKITLPSYQVGIYKDPRLPFKVHCYNGNEGFDMADVENYYGGVELVPEKVKRIYIENDLCYDIRSVVRAISDEHRHLQLTGKIK